MNVSAQQLIQIDAQRSEHFRVADVMQNRVRIAPELGRRSAAIHCVRKRRDRLPPFANCFIATPLPRRDLRQSIVRIRAIRIQLQRVAIIGGRRRCVSRAAKIFRQLEIRLRLLRRSFHHRRQIIFRAGLFDAAQILAVTPGVVKPQVARQLLIAIHRLSLCPRADVMSPRMRGERRAVLAVAFDSKYKPV